MFHQLKLKLQLLLSDIYHTPLKYVLKKSFELLVFKPFQWLINLVSLRSRNRIKSSVTTRRLSLHVDRELLEMPAGMHEVSRQSKKHVFLVFSYPWNLEINSSSTFNEKSKESYLLYAINPSYKPIEWETLESKDSFQILDKELVNKIFDVKYTWEFSRMQHLIPLLLGGSLSKEVTSEVKCQILDFIINNRVGEGIHWSSTMEVAIRAINFLFASELADSRNILNGKDEFEKILNKSLFEHHQFILDHIEHKSGLGNNHYLSNIVGLLFTAYRFEEEKMNASMVQFMDIFIKEVNKQFLDDGVNFESSTTYHAFSLEMSVYGLALILRCQTENNFKDAMLNHEQYQNAIEKVYRAYLFLDCLTTNEGKLIQFGDNDSARLLKFEQSYLLLNKKEFSSRYRQKNYFKSEVIPDEDLLNYLPVLNACRALFGIEHKQSITSKIIRQITRDSILEIPEVPDISINPKTGINIASGLSYKAKSHIKIPDFSVNESKLIKKLYPYGGVYILECNELCIIINGMNRHVKQYWPHGHNDKLSFEVIFKDNSFFRDPGSFTYTGIPSIRNKYRSVKAHNAPLHGKEQNTWIAGAPGVFRMKPRVKVQLVESAANSITLLMNYDNVVHVRCWTINEGQITITDNSNKPFDTNFFPEIFFSNGYGKMTTSYA